MVRNGYHNLSTNLPKNLHWSTENVRQRHIINQNGRAHKTLSLKRSRRALNWVAEEYRLIGAKLARQLTKNWRFFFFGWFAVLKLGTCLCRDSIVTNVTGWIRGEETVTGTLWSSWNAVISYVLIDFSLQPSWLPQRVCNTQNCMIA